MSLPQHRKANTSQNTLSARLFLEHAVSHTFPQSSPLPPGVFSIPWVWYHCRRCRATRWGKTSLVMEHIYIPYMSFWAEITPCLRAPLTGWHPSDTTEWNLVMQPRGAIAKQKCSWTCGKALSQCRESFSNHWIKMWGKHKSHYTNSSNKIWRGRSYIYARSHMDSQKEEQETSVQELGATHQEDYCLNTWAILQEQEKKLAMLYFASWLKGHVWRVRSWCSSISSTTTLVTADSNY